MEDAAEKSQLGSLGLLRNEASIKAWREGNQALVSVAASLGTNLNLQDALQAVFQEGRRQGLDEHDLSALVDVFDPGS